MNSRHLSLILIALLSTVAVTSKAQTFPIVFDFSSTSDTSGTYAATLLNGAELTTFAEYPILDLGQTDGYMNLGADIGTALHDAVAAQETPSYTISVTLLIPSTTSLSAIASAKACNQSDAGQSSASQKVT